MFTQCEKITEENMWIGNMKKLEIPLRKNEHVSLR